MDTVRFFAANTQPNPVEVDYWVDLYDNPYGGSIKYYNGTEWVRLAASGGIPDLSKYYTKVQVNQLLNDKASVQSVESKVDDEEVKDVIKNITFRTSNPNEVQMVLAKYDTTTVAISLPKASDVSAGIVTSDDFKDFVKQIDELTGKLQDEVTRSTNVDNKLTRDLSTESTTARAAEKKNADNIASNTQAIQKEVTDRNAAIKVETDRATDAENKLANDIVTTVETEKDRAEGVEQVIINDLAEEVTRAKAAEQANKTAINKEVTDRQSAIATEVDNRNAAIEVEKQRALKAEDALDSKIATHTNEINTALATKADKSTTYNKTEVDSKISTINQTKQDKLTAGSGIKIENNIISSTLDVQLYKIVDSLPSQDIESGKIYLVLSETTTESNKYTEYVYVNGEWEIIGSYTANVDLSGYLTKTDAASTYQPKGNYALKTEIPDVSTKADTSYVNTQIQTVNTEINKKANKADLHAVATSGNYNDLTNKLKAGSGVTITEDNTINTSVDLSGVTNSISELDSKIEAEISRATIAESNKVDKIVGKGLSTNDYTTAEKNKLNGIAAGAEVNVQSDWNAVSGDAMILNKPTSLPASDVSDWAKAKTKPSYTAAEVGAVATSSYTANDVLNKLKTVDGSGSGLDADTVRGFTIAKSVPSDAKFTDTTYIFANGTDGSFTVTPSGGSAQKVSIGKPAEAMSVKYNTSDITKAENILLGGTDKYHFAIQINKDSDNVPYAELNTGSSGMNPIYVRQYSTEGIINSITLLDPNGNTLFPKTVTANSIVASNLTGSLQGNSTSSTKLQTPRSINGTNFDGSANITTANWGTARNITIGKTAKSVNGSANVSWSASEIANNATTTTDGWMSKEDKQAISSMSSDFYGKEQVTVQLKKGSTNFAGSIIIKNKDNNEVIATSTTGNLTARIIYGVKYVISVPDVDGYYQNTVLEYTASQLVRNIDVVYNALVINTITIDMTITDPATMISGDVNGSVIQNIRNNTHRYAAKKTAEGTVTICQLDDNNSNLFHSGESSTSDSFDRFVRIPRFYYKVDDSNPDIQKIFFCVNKVNNTWQEWDGNDLIGCYEAMISSNKLYSYSGFSSSANISYTQFKQFASNRGTGYRLVTWQQHCMVAILFYAIYGHTNCQAKVGKGTSSNSKVTGYTDSIGMADTVAGGNGDSNSINFLGLENWWGNKTEFIDNIRFNYTSEVSKPNFSIQEYDETWRHVQVGSSTSGWVYPIKLRLGNKLDMFPFDIMQDGSGSSNTGFCDGQYYSFDNDLVVLRSCDFSGAYGGVACVQALYSDSNADTSVGSRLAFRGNIIEEKNVQTFLSL